MKYVRQWLPKAETLKHNRGGSFSRSYCKADVECLCLQAENETDLKTLIRIAKFSGVQIDEKDGVFFLAFFVPYDEPHYKIMLVEL